MVAMQMHVCLQQHSRQILSDLGLSTSMLARIACQGFRPGVPGWRTVQLWRACARDLVGEHWQCSRSRHGIVAAMALFRVATVTCAISVSLAGSSVSLVTQVSLTAYILVSCCVIGPVRGPCSLAGKPPPLRWLCMFSKAACLLCSWPHQAAKAGPGRVLCVCE